MKDADRSGGRMLSRTCAAVILTAMLPVRTARPAELAADRWTMITEGHGSHGPGAVLLWEPEMRKALLVGSAVASFDPAKGEWGDFSSARPPERRGINPYYQTVYDEESRTVYCLSGGTALYSFALAEKAWKKHPPAPELEDLSWLTAALDRKGRRIVVVGSDKRVENVGWTRTVICDIATGKWATLSLPGEDVVKTHREGPGDLLGLGLSGGLQGNACLRG